MSTREQRARRLGISVDQLPDGRGRNPKPRGSAHPRWNEGRMLSDHGYVKVRIGRTHPLADPNGYAYEHALVWAAAGRPRPAPGEVIHHRNEDKTDNKIENLEIRTRPAHAAEHQPMAPDAVVRTIRERYANGEDGTKLAAEYGLPASRVYRFIKGETRVGAGGPIACGCLRGKRDAGRLLDGRAWDEVPA